MPILDFKPFLPCRETGEASPANYNITSNNILGTDVVSDQSLLGVHMENENDAPEQEHNDAQSGIGITTFLRVCDFSYSRETHLTNSLQ